MGRIHISISLGLLIVGSLLSASAWAQTQEPSSATDKTVRAVQAKITPGNSGTSPTDYVGAEVCKTCHEDIYNSWEKSPHWKTTLDTKAGVSHQGCEGCHGPGSAHVPCRWHAAHERHKFGTLQEQRELHVVPFTAPRGNQGIPAHQSAARALLLLPSR
jgi:hypothetical protein